MNKTKMHGLKKAALVATMLLGVILPLKADSTNTEDFLQTFGWVVGSQSGLSELQLSPTELKEVIAGMKASAEGGEIAFNPQADGPGFEGYLTNRSMQIAQATATGQKPNVAEANAEEKRYLEVLGWLIGQQAGLPQLALDRKDVNAFANGIDDALSGRPSKLSLEENGPAIQQFLMQRAAEAIKAEVEVNVAAAAAKTAELLGNPEYKQTESGLIYRIVDSGSDKKPAASDKVRVNYTGWLLDGTMFDSSVERGQPAEFGLDQVIDGWTEGLQLIGEGGEIELYIPYNLAYGKEGKAPVIPPASMLHFNVELLAINPDSSNKAN